MRSHDSLNIKLNAVINALRTFINLLFPLVTFPYVSRILNVEEIGKYNFSQSIISYFILISALGIDKYAIREGTKYRDDRVKMSLFASEIFSINILSTIVSYVLLFILLISSQKLHSYLLCTLIFSFQIFFTTLGTEWLYTIYEDYFYITIRSIVFKILSLIAIFIFVRNEGDYINYACITVFAAVGSNLLNFFNAKKYCDISFFIRFQSLSLLKPILMIFAANVAVQVYVYSDITMLGYMKNDYIVGIYSLSARIYGLVKMVIVSIVTVAIPRLSYYVGKKQFSQYNALLIDTFNLLLVILLPASVGMMMLSENIVLLVGGATFAQSRWSLFILSIALIFCLITSFLLNCILLPYKMEKVFLTGSVISAVANIMLNFILIPIFEEKGAAVTTLISEFIMFTICFIGSKDIVKSIQNRYKQLQNIVSVLIGSSVVVLVCYLVKKFLGTLILQTAVSILASMLIYLFIMILFRNEYALNGIIWIREKMAIDKRREHESNN